nr:hypothetical protein [Paenibacillus senegalimassiliensis]
MVFRHKSTSIRVVPAGAKVLQVSGVVPVFAGITEDVWHGLFLRFRVTPNVVGVRIELVALAIGQPHDIPMTIQLVVLHSAGRFHHSSA